MLPAFRLFSFFFFCSTQDVRNDDAQKGEKEGVKEEKKSWEVIFLDLCVASDSACNDGRPTPDLSQQRLDYFPRISFLREVALPKFKKNAFLLFFPQPSTRTSPLTPSCSRWSRPSSCPSPGKEKGRRKKKKEMLSSRGNRSSAPKGIDQNISS